MAAADTGRDCRPLDASGKTGIIDGTEIRVRYPAAGRKDRDKFISGRSKQNAVKTMVVTDGGRRVLFCSPAQHGSCADITHARQSGLVTLLDGGAAVEILADAGCQGLGAQTAGCVETRPHREFKRHHPSHRRAAVPTADRRPDLRTAHVTPVPPRPTTFHRLLCTSS
ncbi:transposase family protein [Streptomyces sp. NPDC003032]